VVKISKDIPVFPSAIDQLISHQAAIRPEAIALSAPGRSDLSYSQLDHQIQSNARILRQCSVTPDQRVILLLEDGPEATVALISAAAAAIAIPVNHGSRPAEIKLLLDDLKPSIIIYPANSPFPLENMTLPQDCQRIELVFSKQDPAGTCIFRPLDGVNTFVPAEAPRVENIALILQTSGTTGSVKYVPLTHANLCAECEINRQAFQLSPQDTCLNVMPLFHITGLAICALATLASGGRLVAAPGFDPSQFFEWLREFQPTWYSAVPAMQKAILEQTPANFDRLVNSSLRFTRAGSAPFPISLVEKLQETFQIPVLPGYGLTETCGMVSSQIFGSPIHKPGSVGKAISTEITILNLDENRSLNGIEIGEIAIRGATVTPGYWGAPPIQTGKWIRSGDLGYLDEDGFLFVTGRKKDIINRGGEVIAPDEIEKVLLAHPDVAQAVAFPVPDDFLGEDVAAVVVMRNEGISEQDLHEWVAERLILQKVPRRILIVSELPEGRLGKPKRADLAEHFRSRLASNPDRVIIPAASITEKRLVNLCQEILNDDRLTIDLSFLEQGGGSLQAAALLARIQETFVVRLSLVNIFDSNSLQELARLIENRRPSNPG
jgi:oxalate---CoA ligase